LTDLNQIVAELENRLLASLAERDELLRQRDATNEVLQVINASSGDLAPVFDAILERAMRLCEAQFGLLATYDDGQIRTVAARGVPPAFAEFRKNNPPDYGPGTGPARILAGERVVHIADLKSGDAYRTGDPNRRAVVDLGGARTVLLVPLLKNEAVLGYITVYRKEVRLYSDKQIHVLQNFADQAVIAIENARLFKETREALERQTATADILKVIASSPSDVQPVFDAIVTNAVRLSDGFSAGVYRFVDDNVHLGAFTSINPGADEALRASFPRPFADLDHFRIVRQTGKPFPVPDTEDQPHARLKALARARGFRSLLHVPLKSGATSIGTIAISRKNPGPFSAHHVELLQTFADQAVIAIENVRLFNETKEALERQTATADILKVIASSPSNLQPVFDAIAHRSNELLHGHSTTVFRLIDDLIELAAFTRVNEAADAALRAAFPRPRLEMSGLDLVFRGEEHDTIDAQSDAESRSTRDLALARGFRGRLVVPLKSDRGIIGAISITRKEPGAFAYKDRELLRTFADQAVIAIENARLFNETKEALEQQTATAEVLEVISSSPGELDPVFQKMLENACRVCEANFGVMHLLEGDSVVVAADYNLPIAYRNSREGLQVYPHPESGLATVIRTHEISHMTDLREGRAYRAGAPHALKLADVAGARTILVVPMLKEAELIGTITIFRQEVRPFTDKQIALVKNFTKQAVIAIENTRLLKELRMRTQELSQSLDDLRAAQDRLVQTEKLASLGQLTAGIAHEIKNPLNFINNFSALSAELTDELNDVLKPIAMEGNVRGEVDELTGLLKENLGRVVQHGKRADSIVKNMLLHSREGSGEHRPADINSLLDDSLNLAYHGARAEKGEFNIVVQRDFDADAGTIEIFPQDITRAFLNLISNGVYAATKGSTDKKPGFEPTLRASTKNLGSAVEIRIRDNGTGILAEVREKMFNPFFTTKPAGEGTGLGLSMTHDIIVKQHGGRIDVATEPGQFTEFIIILPRKGNVSGRDRGKT
jgi:two-component system, NtrC family, sensor kinase